MSELPYSVDAAERAARALDVDEIRANNEAQDLATQFIARDGRDDTEQLTDLLNKARNKMADHMATHGCYRCARAFVRGFTSTGPNPESFCRVGMELLLRVAFSTKALMKGEPDAPPDPSHST